MRPKVICMMILSFAFSMLAVSEAFCEDKKEVVNETSVQVQSSDTKEAETAAVAEKGNDKAPTEAEKKMTKKGMALALTNMFKYHPNIASSIQGVMVKGEGDNSYCEYNGKKLDELDEETLLALLRKGNNLLSLENLQKLDQQQRQLRNLKQIEQLQRTQQTLNQSRTVPNTPAAPKVYTAPNIPKTYKPTKY